LNENRLKISKTQSSITTNEFKQIVKELSKPRESCCKIWDTVFKYVVVLIIAIVLLCTICRIGEQNYVSTNTRTIEIKGLPENVQTIKIGG
jgi:hypothetical protein